MYHYNIESHEQSIAETPDVDATTRRARLLRMPFSDTVSAPNGPAPSVITLNDMAHFVLAFVLPPAAVWAKRGCCSTCCGCGAPELEEARGADGRVEYVRRGGSWDLLINVLLFFLGVVPGALSAGHFLARVRI